MLATAGLVAERSCDFRIFGFDDLRGALLPQVFWSDSDKEQYGSDPFADESMLLEVAGELRDLFKRPHGQLWACFCEQALALFRDLEVPWRSWQSMEG